MNNDENQNYNNKNTESFIQDMEKLKEQFQKQKTKISPNQPDENSSMIQQDDGFDAKAFYHKQRPPSFEKIQEPEEERNVYKDVPNNPEDSFIRTESNESYFNSDNIYSQSNEDMKRAKEQFVKPHSNEKKYTPYKNEDYDRPKSYNIESSDNPLRQFFRQPKLSVKLPSKGQWYPNDFLKTSPTGELEVYAMTAEDELTLKNPDSLMSGHSILRILQSCVPGITKHSDLYIPDIDVLLIAIRIASYGPVTKLNIPCPNCKMIYNNKIKTDGIDEAGKLVSDEIISIKDQSFDMDLKSIVNDISFLPYENIITFENIEDLKNVIIKIRPSTFKNIALAGAIEFEQKKIFQVLEKEEELSNDQKLKMFNKSLEKIRSNNRDIILSCIESFETTDKSLRVVDKHHIGEFLDQCSIEVINKIEKKIKELTDMGYRKNINLTCKFCGHKWNEDNIEFNPTNFFVQGS